MPDAVTVDYLWPFIKKDYASDKKKALNDFRKWHPDPDASYEKVLEVEADKLKPVATFGYKPDQVKPIEEMKNVKINQVYIGSCTNGRISDLREAAKIAKLKPLAEGVRGILSPATPEVYKSAMEEGLIKIFMEAGYCVTNPTCGACLGMSNGVLAEGEVCASTTNRNFNGRMGKGGMVHLMSPASAAASGIMGRLSDPRKFMGKN